MLNKYIVDRTHSPLTCQQYSAFIQQAVDVGNLVNHIGIGVQFSRNLFNRFQSSFGQVDIVFGIVETNHKVVGARCTTIRVVDVLQLLLENN